MANNIDELSIQISASAKSATSQIDKLVGSLTNLSNVIAGIDSSKVSSLGSSLKDVSSGLSGISSNKSAVTTLRSIGKSLGSVAQQGKAINNVSQAVNQVGTSANSATSNIINFGQKIQSVSSVTLPLSETAKKFQELSKPLDTSTTKLQEFQNKMKNLKIIVPTQGLVDVQKEIKKVESQYNRLKEQISIKVTNKTGYVDSDANKQDVAKLEGLRNQYDKLMQKQKELSVNGGYKINAPNFSKFKKELKDVDSLIQSIMSKIKGFGKSIGSVFSGVANKVKNAAKALTSMGHSSEGASKGIIASNKSLEKTLKTLTRTYKMLRLMVLRKILQAVIGNAIDGFNNMAQYSDKFNASVSLLWNSLRQLGNAIGAMVAPLLNYFAPAINKVIQLLIEAVNWFNQLFSAMTGASTWSKAKTLNDDYAASLDKSNKKAKELAKTVLGFDELNQLKDNSSDESSATNPTDMFEEVDTKFKDIANKIKELWNELIDPLKKAWSNVGSFVVDNFKKAADKLKKLFKSIASDWLEVWGQAETQEILEDILATIGRILGIIGELADRIREAWEYNNNGKRFLEGIRDIIGVIVKWIRRAAEATESWAKHLDLKPLFSSITEYVESLVPVVESLMNILYDFYNMVLLPLASWTLEKGLPQLFDIFKNFNNNIDMDGIKKSFDKLWEALEPFAEKVGQGLIDFIDLLADVVIEFVNSGVLDSIISALADFLSYLTNLELDVDTEPLKKSFESFLDSLKPVIESIEGMFEDFIEDFLKPLAEWTIGEGLPSLLDTITELNNAGLFENLRSAFDDLWKILEPFAKKVGEGLVIFIGDVGTKLNEFLMSEDWNEFVDTLKTWTDDVSAEDVADGLEKICEAIVVYKAASFGVAVMSGLVTVLKFIKDSGTSVAKGCETIAGGILGIRTAFKTVVAFMVTPAFLSFTEFLGNPASVINISNLIDFIRHTWLDPDEWSDLFGRLFDYLGIIWNNLWTIIGAPLGALEEGGFESYFKKNWQTFDEYNESIKKLKESGKDLGGTYEEITTRARWLTEETSNGIAQTAEKVKSSNDAIDSTDAPLKTYAENWRNVKQDTTSSIKEMSDSAKDFRDWLYNDDSVKKYTSDTSKSYSGMDKDVQEVLNKFEGKTKKVYESVEMETAYMQTTMSAELKTLSKNTDTSCDDIVNSTEDVKKAFAEDHWKLEGIKNGLSGAFQSAIEAIKEKWNSFAKWLNERMEISVDTGTLIGKGLQELFGTSKIRLFDLPTFATGGFPEDGLFMANHSEMVGKFSNGKSVVANNEQIVEGIKAGVYEAVSMAMSQNSGGSEYISNTIQIDGETIARSITKAQNRQNYRYSPTY